MDAQRSSLVGMIKLQKGPRTNLKLKTKKVHKVPVKRTEIFSWEAVDGGCSAARGVKKFEMPCMFAQLWQDNDVLKGFLFHGLL